MQQSTDAGPITGLCIVTDPASCPAGYTVIDKSYDRQEDADLWKDGFFVMRRVTRYVCISRQFQNNGLDNVLIDIALINERDVIPVGFSITEFTIDTHEKATKKKNICLKMADRQTTTEAISDIIILSRSGRPPNGYTLIGEMNDLHFCYKLGSVSKAGQNQNSFQQFLPYEFHRVQLPYFTDIQHSMAASNLPYAMRGRVNADDQYWSSSNASASYGAPPRPPPPAVLNRESTLLRHLALSPLSGIPFELNSKYANLTENNENAVPSLKYKSFYEIEKEYEHSFRCEQTAIAARSSPD
ncbi:multivesicular body subunit 12B-like isoform X1 [Tubulanus polymorphus]|uniref:multivesicular body subunit 12B-like isoform X1 n=1 Tax=Tubulanus polymorphus TaxID=672921 RepID=UPI003DA21BF3